MSSTRADSRSDCPPAASPPPLFTTLCRTTCVRWSARCSGATLRARGSDFDCVIDVVPGGELVLRRVEFVMNGAVRSQHVELIGHSTLTVGPGRRALWTFAHSRSGR